MPRNRFSQRVRPLWFLLVSLLLLVGCAAPGDVGHPLPGAQPERQGDGLTKVRFQLRWIPQAQFAGYFVALDQGYYREEGLDVQILPAGPDLNAADQVADGFADIGTDWVPSFLAHVDQGQPLIQFAQVFQHSGLVTVYWKDQGIAGPADLRGKRVGTWFGGSEFEFLALLERYNLEPGSDVEVIPQGFTMAAFLNRELDAAAAMTYNEYWQAIDAGVDPDAMGIIDYNAEGLAMLQDNLFARADWLEANEETAVRFLRATMKGWAEAVANPEAAAKLLMKHTLPGATTELHQLRMMQGVAKIVLPPGFTPERIGSIDPEAYQRTAELAHRFQLLQRPADLATVYTTRIVEAARGR